MTCKSCNISKSGTIHHKSPLDKKVHALRMKIHCLRTKLARLHTDKRKKRKARVHPEAHKPKAHKPKKHSKRD